jgi:hypothetical protein
MGGGDPSRLPLNHGYGENPPLIPALRPASRVLATRLFVSNQTDQHKSMSNIDL